MENYIIIIKPAARIIHTSAVKLRLTSWERFSADHHHFIQFFQQLLVKLP